jgi:hypothetical protein
VTGRDLIIDAPARRSRFLRWRDRCFTLLLWSAWSRPVEAIARLTTGAPPDGGLVWDAFLRDLGDASSAAGVLIVLLYAWGGYGRVRVHRTSARGPGLTRTRLGFRPRG